MASAFDAHAGAAGGSAASVAKIAGAQDIQAQSGGERRASLGSGNIFSSARQRVDAGMRACAKFEVLRWWGVELARVLKAVQVSRSHQRGR